MHILKTIKIQVASEWGPSPKLASGSLWWMRVEPRPLKVSPLLLHLPLLHLSYHVDPLTSLALPSLGRLGVLVQCLLHVQNMDDKLSVSRAVAEEYHLLVMGGPPLELELVAMGVAHPLPAAPGQADHSHPGGKQVGPNRGAYPGVPPDMYPAEAHPVCGCCCCYVAALLDMLLIILPETLARLAFSCGTRGMISEQELYNRNFGLGYRISFA